MRFADISTLLYNKWVTDILYVHTHYTPAAEICRQDIGTFPSEPWMVILLAVYTNNN